MKKISALLLALLLLSVLPLSATAATVQEQIDALPTVEEFKRMDEKAQLEAYNRTQSAYDAYMALTGEEKKEITGSEAFETLFAYFNSQIMPIDQTEALEQPDPQQEPESGMNWTSTLIAAAVVLVIGWAAKRLR